MKVVGCPERVDEDVGQGDTKGVGDVEAQRVLQPRQTAVFRLSDASELRSFKSINCGMLVFVQKLSLYLRQEEAENATITCRGRRYF